MPLDGVSALALLLLASFVIERVVSGVLFTFPTFHLLSDPAQLEGKARVQAERRMTYARFLLSGVLVAAVLKEWDTLRILELFGQAQGSPPWLDPAVSWVVLMGGADRIAALVKIPVRPTPARSAEPVEVRGRLEVDDSRVVR